ncbi:MAG: DUF1150 family protein [Alphaproteobacteria bacterium]|nr:DUF1150 family protein [Alphaproteobacteria bacterium]
MLRPVSAKQQLRKLSPVAFAALGREGVAYIKPVWVEGEWLCAVFLADGRHVAMTSRRDLAEVMVRQNDLEPVSVH